MSNFETIKLDKGLYRTKKGFLNELESADPSENYKGTSLEGLDAFERQLKRFDIKINGADSSPIEKFFATTDSAVLFPEYISRTVRESIKSNTNLDDILAAKTNINGLDYRTLTSIPSESDLELKNVNEGAFIPETTIKTKENLVRLKKKGRTLVSSYEAIRFQRLDIFNITLRQIGKYIATSLFKDAIDTLIDGDGNNNPIDKTTNTTISDISTLDLWKDLFPYNLTTLLATPNVYSKLCASNIFNTILSNSNFYISGKPVSPLGTKLIRVPGSKEFLLGLDKDFALEMITAGDVMTDTDKLIDRQLQRTTITQIAGFAKIANDASKMIEQTP